MTCLHRCGGATKTPIEILHLVEDVLMKYKTVVIDHLNCLFSNEMRFPDCCISFAFQCS